MDLRKTIAASNWETVRTHRRLSTSKTIFPHTNEESKQTVRVLNCHYEEFKTVETGQKNTIPESRFFKVTRRCARLVMTLTGVMRSSKPSASKRVLSQETSLKIKMLFLSGRGRNAKFSGPDSQLGFLLDMEMWESCNQQNKTSKVFRTIHESSIKVFPTKHIKLH